MADYLTDLAMGLGESAGALRPRQASRFEPPSPEDQIPTSRQPLEQAEELDSPRAQDASRELPPRAAKSAISRADAGSFQEMPGDPDTVASIARHRSEAGKTVADVPPSIDRKPPSRESVQAALGSEAPFSVRDVSLRRPVEPRAEIEPEGVPTPTPPPFAIETAQPVEPRPSGPIDLPVDAAITREPATDSPAERANSIFRPPPLSPPSIRAREQPSQSERRPEKPAEPTIHVTIGRVEVRATTEPEARARKKEEASRVMTLDEYLRKRGSR